MTPGGKLQAGDRIRHRESRLICTVIKRNGNDDLYSVVVRPDHWEHYMRPVYGYTDAFLMLEAAYWIGPSGTYEVIKDDRQFR